jgi:hypothetical protein
MLKERGGTLHIDLAHPRDVCEPPRAHWLRLSESIWPAKRPVIIDRMTGRPNTGRKT